LEGYAVTVRLKEVAQYLGVSVSTISRVVNQKDRVSEHTRKMVEDAIKKLDYQPNEPASVLRGKQSRTIGVVVGDISNMFFARLIKGSEHAAVNEGYNILVCNTDDNIEREHKSIELLYSKNVSGMILAASSYDFADKIVSSRQIPYVYVDNLPKTRIPCDSITIDNFAASVELTEHLISYGHRRIAIIAGDQGVSTGVDRLEGWRQTMSLHGLEIIDSLIESGNFTMEFGYTAAQRIMALRERPTAIFAANNNLAYGAMRAFRDLGYSIPEDISLVAFDADDVTGLITPKLTSVNQPVFDFGRMAVNLCLEKCRQNSYDKHEHVVLPHVFFAGESVAAAQ
jgi:DNA-binding LacI/PurR family transcriptional regulator